MKFTCTVEIKQPIDEVVKLFDNPENLREWQDGFESFDHISGTPGEPQAQSRLVYKQGKGSMELIETILVNDLPREFSATYDHKHMSNIMTNRFSSLDENRTRWDAEINYTEFKSFMPKLMAFLFPGMFRKQVQKWLDQFKAFAENNNTD